MLQRAKLYEHVNADIGALVSAAPGWWLWRNLPVPVWQTSSVRFSKRFSICSARNHCTKTTGLNFPAQTQATYILSVETRCSTPLIFYSQAALICLSHSLCTVLFQKQSFSMCADCSTCHDCQFPAPSLALHWPTGTLIKELCTVMTRIDFQFPVEWLYHCLWLRQFSLYYSAVWGL